MKNLYLVADENKLRDLKEYTQQILPLFEKYLLYLKDNYQVMELPRAIVWTDHETATNVISDIPVPAYTNDYRTVMVPDIEVWKNLYLKQLDEYAKTNDTIKLRNYYEKLSGHNVLQILGHEMAHHSELFIDEAYETEMWFEEGMVEYISRKFFLTEEEYDAEKEYMLLGLRKIAGVNISEFKLKFGDNPIYLFRNELKKLTDEGLIIVDEDYIRLTNKGIDLANLVWEEFV